MLCNLKLLIDSHQIIFDVHLLGSTFRFIMTSNLQRVTSHAWHKQIWQLPHCCRIHHFTRWASLLVLPWTGTAFISISIHSERSIMISPLVM